MKRICLLLLLIVMAAHPCRADEPPGPPTLHSIYSRNREFEAVLDPNSNTTTVYKLEKSGRRLRQWSMRGYYRVAFLDNDGRHLVIGQDGNNLLRQDYRDSWIMVSFYDRGQLIQAYSLSDIILDRSKLRPTASHYRWGYFVGIDKRGQFVIDTDENLRLVFNVVTGRRIKTVLPVRDEMLDDEPPTAEEKAADEAAHRLQAWKSSRSHGAAAAVAFSPDGNYVLSAHYNGTVYLRALATGIELRRFGETHPFNHTLEFSPNGKSILLGNQEFLRLMDTTTGNEVRRFEVPSVQIHCATFAPDGGRIYAGMHDGTIRIWDTGTGKESGRFEGRVSSIATSRDGTYVLGGSYDGIVHLWSASDGREIRRLDAGLESNSAVAISPDSKYVLMAGYKDSKGVALLWEISTGKPLRAFKGHSYYIYVVGFSADGRQALTASGDDTARLWDVNSGQEIRCFNAKAGHNQSSNEAAISPDGTRVITAGNTGVIRLWNVATGKEIRRF